MEISDEQIKRIYRNIDSDNSGFIEVYDLITLVRAVPSDTEKPQPGKADAIKAGDKDMPPEMIKKFIDRLKQCAFKNNGMKVNYEWFRSLDHSKNGKLDMEEWLEAVRVGMKLTTADCTDACAKKIFQALDTDSSGQLDIEEIGDLAKDIHSDENPQLASMVQETKKLAMELSTCMAEAPDHSHLSLVEEAGAQFTTSTGQFTTSTGLYNGGGTYGGVPTYSSTGGLSTGASTSGLSNYGSSGIAIAPPPLTSGYSTSGPSGRPVRAAVVTDLRDGGGGEQECRCEGAEDLWYN